MAEDYYATLGVEKDASPQDIKRAFRQIARECHPDVAGEDVAAAERFKNARKAYETLIDPVTRARYDRRGQRRGNVPKGGSFFDAFYRHKSTLEDEPAPPEPKKTEPGFSGWGAHDSGGHASGGRKSASRAENDLDLDDLFKDFGDFGFGGKKRRGGARGPTPPPEPSAGGGSPTAGAEVHIEVDVPAQVARDGGTVTAVYYRMQRADSWRPGSSDPGVVRIQDIADIRVIPGTRDGEVLRERGLGDAGTWGGSYGDLVVRVRLVGSAPKPKPPPEPPPPEVEEPPPPPPTVREPPETPRPPEIEDPPRPEPEPPRRDDPTEEARAAAIDNGTVTLDISVVEALLGGRVPLKTPQGTVRLSIPPGTSSGTRMRLKAKGEPDAAGTPVDLYVAVRIVVPKQLDDESRQLVERFAALNPGVPRG